MKKNLRKQCKGAVTIFLIIIFLSCYILTGLLVDGGRYRMAMAMAESSLDSAADSVLSRYNKLVYDLYGLLATENVTEDELISQFQRYVSDTLSIADIDYGDYQTLLGQALAGSVSGEDRYFDGYDFDIDIQAGSSVTLATTENVEYQIIEHMKYRGPVQLAGQPGSFLNKLEQILSVKNRIEAASKRLQVTNANKGTFQQCRELMDAINQYNDQVRAFSFTGDYTKKLSESISGSDVWNIFSYILDFETKVKGLHQEENEEIQRRIEQAQAESEEGEESEGGQVDEEAIRREVMEEYDPRFEAMRTEYQEIYSGSLEAGFTHLYQEGQRLYEAIEDMNAKYTQYIRELETKMNEHPNDEDYKTVFLPEIELAKANCGQVLERIDLVVNARGYAGDVERLYYQTGIVGIMEDEAKTFVERIRDDEGDSMTNHPGLPSGRESSEYVKMVSESMIKLQDISGYFYEARQQEINVRNSDVREGASSEEEPEAPSDGIRDLSEADLQVAFTQSILPAGSDLTIDVAGTVDSEDAGKLMEEGLNLMEMLGSLLESARDRIYVDEYILHTFPNAVYHHEMSEDDRKNSIQEGKNLSFGESPEWDSGPDYLLDESYWKYFATEAEVEYILTGTADGDRAFDQVKGKLLAFRTIINGVAIFTDSAKINQANAIAALSGPFAPLVSIALLLGWAVAESVMDVLSLTRGETVVFWKQGADWEASLEGAFKRVVNAARDGLIDYAKDRTDQIFDLVDMKIQGAIYDVYNKAGEAGESADQVMERTLGQFETAAAQCGSQESQDAMKEIHHKYREAREDIKDFVDQEKDRVVMTVAEKTRQMRETVHDSVESKLNSVAKDVIENFKDKIPVGQVVSTGGHDVSSFRMGYSDYMRIFLLLMSQQTKVERIQQVIQANMRYGGQTGFSMEQSYTGVWADMKCSIKFLFMSEPVIPSDLKQNGRLKFQVHTSRAY